MIVRLAIASLLLAARHSLTNYSPPAKVTAMSLDLLPLSHQDVLRDECAGVLRDTVPPTNSVLGHFVGKNIDTGTFECVFHEQGQPCKYTRIKRFNRALAHVRRHLNLRQFRCLGACGKGHW